MCGFEHVESKCGHVSIVLLGHSVQFGFGYKLGLKIFLRWLPIYWAYRNFRVCVIWASVDSRFSQNWLESLWLIWSMDVHLSTYVNLDWANLSSRFMCSLLMYVCRLRIAPIWAPVGTPLSKYGMVCDVCILWVLVGLSRRAPSFASWSAISLPIMYVCVVSFWIMILCVDQVMWLTKAAMNNLSGWLSWDDGCCMWFVLGICYQGYISSTPMCYTKYHIVNILHFKSYFMLTNSAMLTICKLDSTRPLGI